MFYPSLQVKAHPSVSTHMLCDLDDVKKSNTEATLLLPTLVLIDIAGYASNLNHKKFCFLVDAKTKIHRSNDYLSILECCSVYFLAAKISTTTIFSCFLSNLDEL